MATTGTTQNHLRPYEVVLIMDPDSTEDQQKDLFRKNKSTIESNGGSIYHVDTWGRRPLANPIAKHKRGIYFHASFMAAPETISELERTMRINDRVLRFQHTRLDERISLSQYNEKFKKALAETAQREREREAKSAARRAQASANRGDRPDRGDRGDRGDRPERGERFEKGDRSERGPKN